MRRRKALTQYIKELDKEKILEVFSSIFSSKL
jgi:hypothetical protein